MKNKHKFACPWIGPYKVLNKVTEVDYRIQRLSRKPDTRVVHVDHLKPYEKDYEPSMDNLGLPPLILDEDYLDLVDDKAHKEYLDVLEPILDTKSDSPVLSESGPQAPFPIPDYSPVVLRRGNRSVKSPRRYGYCSNPLRIASVYWF